MSARTTATDELRDRIEGAVIGPDDPRYEGARGAWNLAATHRPALIVEAASADDVVETVRHAASRGLSVAVQTTGHAVTLPADDAVLLLMRGMDGVEIDAGARTARVGGGARWGPVLAGAQEHGLAPLVGSSPGVGVVGYTLGGGFGWLGRRYGLAVDRVRSLDVVLADGSLVTASEESRADLFWALCGAGAGTLGVVVGMEMELVEVGTVYAGNLLYPAEAAAEAFAFHQEWASELPEELTSAFSVMDVPPLPDVPEPLRGRQFTVVRGCHSGDVAEGKALIDRWREWRAPEIDMFGPMPFAEMAQISQDPEDPVPAISSGRWLTGIDEGVAEAMIDAALGGDGPSPILFAEARHAGGALARRNDGACYAGRGAERLLQVVGMIPDEAAAAEAEQRIAGLWERLADRIAPEGAYLNFTEGEERRAEARATFDDEAWRRLVRIKAQLDPGGVFAHGIDLSESVGSHGDAHPTGRAAPQAVSSEG